jgi:cell division septal protein FtsQ
MEILSSIISMIIVVVVVCIIIIVIIIIIIIIIIIQVNLGQICLTGPNNVSQKIIYKRNINNL